MLERNLQKDFNQKMRVLTSMVNISVIVLQTTSHSSQTSWKTDQRE